METEQEIEAWDPHKPQSIHHTRRALARRQEKLYCAVTHNTNRVVLLLNYQEAEVWDFSSVGGAGDKVTTSKLKDCRYTPGDLFFMSDGGDWLVFRSFAGAGAKDLPRSMRWDLRAPQLAPQTIEFKNNSGLRMLQESIDRKWLLAIDGGVGTLWDLTSKQALPVSLGAGIQLQTAAFSSDSLRLVATDQANLHVWDLKPGMAEQEHRHRRIDARDNKGVLADGVAVSPDGSKLAAIGRDTLIRVWDLQAPRPATVLYGHQVFAPFMLFIGPDGKKVISIDFDREIIRVSTVGMESFLSLAERTVGRNLRQDEWDEVVQEPYRKTFDTLP